MTEEIAMDRYSQKQEFYLAIRNKNKQQEILTNVRKFLCKDMRYR